MASDLPRPGLGTSGMTGDECTESVRRALELGHRHVDTAQMYDNERAVGEGIRRADVDREAITVATKVHPDNLAPGDVVATTRESLDRLGLDRVDLLYVHWPIRTYDPAETLPAMDRAHEEGLTAAVGVSNFTPELLVEAVDVLTAPVVANQFECHPLLPQPDLQEHCHEHGVQVVAYSPLAQGEALDVPELQEVAAAHDATPAQVSLAWLLARDAVPIPKARGDHLTENWAARDLELSDDELATIDGIDRRHRTVDPDGAPWN